MGTSIGGVLFLACTVFCAVNAVRNWNTYKKGRRRPLLDGVTAERLMAIPISWPLDDRRWPPPWSGDDRKLPAEVARAYFRLADRLKRNLLLLSEVLLVVGGSWLGVTLPDIWRDYRASS